MKDTNRLRDTFEETEYQLAGHGKRTARILKEAFAQVDDGLKSDHYGEGQVIDAFQDKMAKLLGKEETVFFPSGTMAQQIALRIWSDEEGIRKVGYHPLSHLEIHEENGLQELHGIQSILLADRNSIITLEDIVNMQEKVACILLELPQREIGGQLPDYKTLEDISAYCREHGIRLHLDGARLLEVLPYYGKTAAEISALFDSVYISVYKGIGGIAGAVLAGNAEFIQQSKVWKRRHGGDLISLYPYIVSADYYFDQRVNQMRRYYEDATELAGYFNNVPAVTTLPEVPVSNMFHVHIALPEEQAAEAIAAAQEQTGIGITGYVRKIDDHNCYFEVSLGDQYANLSAAEVRKVFQQFDSEIKKVMS
ncbi:threonine aldolase family protein [Planococcus lenghuensis]|uniref:Low specificity L-threonine aldolase n=1 Tax=Planococcus lenghuensis TaxID=2213202 RepID=A0A1Q2L0T1_9BACL|nr:aminotransferase class I/II-fold pyridoxal phosphate-dependent enzyme [Planococcus lenghuensis]AQQ54023.1 low specificity L-threonine aldolase [Planococcus lenghuensis]